MKENETFGMFSWIWICCLLYLKKNMIQEGTNQICIVTDYDFPDVAITAHMKL